LSVKRRNRRNRGKELRRGTSKKLLLVTVSVAAVIVTLLTLLILLRDSPTPFQRAVENPQEREGFVERMVKRFPPPPSVEAVLYTEEKNFGLEDDASSALNPHSLMVASGPPIVTEELGHTDYRMRILVGPGSFSEETIENEADWVGALFHEYAHTELFGRGGFETETLGLLSIHVHFASVVNEEIFVHLAELDAIRQELQRAGPKNSEAYLEGRKQRYFGHYVALWDAESLLGQELTSSLKVEYFPLETFNLSFEDATGFLEIRSTEGERFALTSDEVKNIQKRIARRGGGP